MNLEDQKGRKPKTPRMCLRDSVNLKNVLLAKFGMMQGNLSIKNAVIIPID